MVPTGAPCTDSLNFMKLALQSAVGASQRISAGKLAFPESTGSVGVWKQRPLRCYWIAGTLNHVASEFVNIAGTSR